jgi:hypothetical protein
MVLVVNLFFLIKEKNKLTINVFPPPGGPEI